MRFLIESIRSRFSKRLHFDFTSTSLRLHLFDFIYGMSDLIDGMSEFIDAVFELVGGVVEFIGLLF